MDWSGYGQEMRRAKKRKELVETERVVRNGMIDLESQLSGGNLKKEVAGEDAKSLPRLWLYGGPLTLVCQWCDTTLFTSPEDADFADLEKVVEDHVCETEGEGTA